MKIPFGTAAVNAVLGYAVVFFGLLLLMCVVVIMGRVMLSRKGAKTPAHTSAPAAPAAPAPQPAPKVAVEIPEAPGSAGELKLYNVPDKEAAMIMAIVANELQVPLNTLRFKSIKEIL
ncbi:MAG: OadG family protein [Oscillospiraceae bacterium]|nr:OadG family protein [Oscillospiraceae bacterium]